jgi:hypothetical protein
MRMLTIFTAPEVKRRLIAASDRERCSLSAVIVVTLLRHYQPKGASDIEEFTRRCSSRTNVRPTIAEGMVTSKDGRVPSQAKIPEELHEKIAESAKKNWRSVAREIARVLTEECESREASRD